LLGIFNSYAQPLLIKIPQTISRVETEGETAWLSFPDALQDEESLEEMLGKVLQLENLQTSKAEKLRSEATEVVGLSRSICLNLMVRSGLDREANIMAQTIWSHVEKASRSGQRIPMDSSATIPAQNGDRTSSN